MKEINAEKATYGGILQFTQLVAQDQNLQSLFRPAANLELFVEVFVSAGRQRGYRFGSSEVVTLLAARRAANDDLSDQQLDAVVGGVGQADAGLYAFIDGLFPNGFK